MIFNVGIIIAKQFFSCVDQILFLKWKHCFHQLVHVTVAQGTGVQMQGLCQNDHIVLMTLIDV